jgi:hypothetical protein
MMYGASLHRRKNPLLLSRIYLFFDFEWGETNPTSRQLSMASASVQKLQSDVKIMDTEASMIIGRASAKQLA